MPRATPLPADERRAAILAATEPLVMQLGREVSTRQIAEAAGIAEGTIFRVFPNKDAVIDAVLEDAFDITATLAGLAGIDADAPLADRLEEAVAVLEAQLRRVIALFGAFRREPPPPGEQEDQARAHETHERRRREDSQRLNLALAAVIGADADRLRVPAEQAADLLRGVVFTVTHPAIGTSFPSEPRVIVDTLLHGVLTPISQESRPC